MDQTATTGSGESALDPRELAALVKSRGFSDARVRLLLSLKETLMLGMGLVLGQWRDSRDPVTGAFAEHCQAEIRSREWSSELEILRSRFGRLPPAQRIRYSPEERFRIVLHNRTYGLTYRESGERFMINPKTVARWTHEATREPDKTTVGSLLKATPPLRTYDDVTKRLVAELDEMRIGGSKAISQMLLRAGKKVSRETVRRYRKNPPPIAPSPEPPRDKDKDKHNEPSALRAKSPNHVWMTDITSIPTFFRIWTFKLVVMLDVFSRFPLAFQVFTKEPTSDDIATLVQHAADRYGKPEHFVTDRGSQFTAPTFVEKLCELGVLQRFGAIGQSGSIAVIERFWRTVKEMLDVKRLPPLSRSHLHDRVTTALNYYATLRPHQGLAGATPAEIYFGMTPVTLCATNPPRATAREPTSATTLPHAVAFAFANSEQRLGFLIPQRRAA